MAASFFVVPQWQGSGSARAMRLADGAHAISHDLPAASTTLIDVPIGAGDALGTSVARLSSLLMVRDRLAAALLAHGGPAVTIGGDCGVQLAAVPHALTHSPDTCVVWFDAHPDLNTPQSSPSGAFTGMVLRTLLGHGADELVCADPLAPQRVVVVGARQLDDGEAEFIEQEGIRMIAPTAGIGEQDAGAAMIAELLDAVESTGATSVYIHVDLDVLDPGIIQGIGSPVPFGLSAADLVAMIAALRGRYALSGAGITEFAPASPEEADDDMATILRIIGALTR
ncbi:arginase family protein [Salinibacterium hongtaonis]|nr:arginase family protein [Salinibacterium hongtaonis]